MAEVRPSSEALGMAGLTTADGPKCVAGLLRP